MIDMTEIVVNWKALPEIQHWKSLSGYSTKFVQVEAVGKKYLRFVNEEDVEISDYLDYVTAAGILKNLLEELGVSYDTIRAEDGIRIPDKSGEAYVVYGAGYMNISGIVDGRPSARFEGQSIYYKVGFDKSDLPALRSQKPNWEIM